MKAASAALLTLLTTRQFYAADLFKITLVGGTVLSYAAGTADITSDEGDLTLVADVTLIADLVTLGLYTSGGPATGPYFLREDEASQLMQRADLQTDDLHFTVYPGSSTVLGVSWQQAVIAGVFDGALIQLRRAFMGSYGNTTPGTLLMFAGRITEVAVSRAGGILFTCASYNELLDQNFPRNLYLSSCIWTLFDTGCALAKASFQQVGSAAAGSTAMIVKAALAQATGYFDLGSIQFTSGANAGQVRGVRKYTQGAPGTLVLLGPLPSAPAAGDTFIATAGCDKLQATCSGKFNNLINHRGFGYVPTPETAL